MEREKGRREAVADMSEDLSEGEKGDTISEISAHGESNRGRLPRISSVETMEAWASQQKEKKLYIVLIRYSVNAFFDLMLLTSFIIISVIWRLDKGQHIPQLFPRPLPQ